MSERPEADDRGVLPTASTLLTDPVPPLLQLLVALGAMAAVTLASWWLAMFLWRERMLRTVSAQHPEGAAEYRKAARAVPLLFRRVSKVPADPYARTHRVVVPPWGDGRPGEAFWAPGPGIPQNALGPDGSRQDALVTLGPGVHMIVVCFGRIGALQGADAIGTAAERVERARTLYDEGRTALGPVDRMDLAMGTGWRTTCVFASGTALTDMHVDHDGWAFVVGVLSRSMHARAVEALDGILATWTWLPAGER